MTLFSIAAVMIVPFVKIYTSGITDAQYENQLFAIMLIIASLLYIFRMPYGSMIIAAGRFKETRMAAYGEAIINIATSIVLVIFFGIVGVAIGTVLATLFRSVCYMAYLSKHILHRNISLWIKRIALNAFVFACIYIGGSMIISSCPMNGYLEWAIAAVPISVVAGILTFGINYMVYKDDVLAILKRGFRKQ